MELGRPSDQDHASGDEPGDGPSTPSGSRSAESAESAESAGAPGGGSGRVLVCDDAEQIRRLIRVNLEIDGYQVVEAVDGEEALEILKDMTQPLPDVITVDVVMPRRDGWWMVEAIRSDPRLAHIPIVMVTASAQDQDRAKADRAAVDEFVSKPFDPEDLVAKIGILVSGKRPEVPL